MQNAKHKLQEQKTKFAIMKSRRYKTVVQEKRTIKCVQDLYQLTKGQTYIIDSETVGYNDNRYFIRADDGEMRTYLQSNFIPPTEIEEIALLIRLEVKSQ